MDLSVDTFSQSYDAAGMQPGASKQPGGNAARNLTTFILHEFIEGLVSLRTQDLIANLLDLSAAEQFISKKGRCDVGAVLKESLEHHKLAAARKQIVFLSGISGGLWAQASRTVLRQVFDNVISNAVKHSPANATIQVHALIENGSVMVNVRDQGVGINEDGRQKLFQKFAQLVAGPADGVNGIDVRQAIVKKLAETLSGSVRWRSALGSGSTFTLKLPVSNGPAESEELPDITMLARNIVEMAEPMPRVASRN
jgi:signal transduction histidine kinase